MYFLAACLHTHKKKQMKKENNSSLSLQNLLGLSPLSLIERFGSRPETTLFSRVSLNYFPLVNLVGNNNNNNKK